MARKDAQCNSSLVLMSTTTVIIQLLYSKSVRDLAQWSLRTLLRNPQTLVAPSLSLRMLQPRAFGSLKRCRDLGLGL